MIRFALVDDERLVADSLSTLLSLEDDLVSAGVYYSGEDFLASGCQADVVVTDLELGGGMDGVELAQRTEAPVVLVSSHARPAVLKRALAAGIQAVLPKTASSDAFADAIRAADSGKRWIDPNLAAAALADDASPLTEREAELVVLAGRGLSIADIARSAHVAEGTARNYLSSAMGKVGAANRFEAYTLAREKGWV
ncbi:MULTISPECIES: response regulator transcription factor [unclassified Corynebacterium]|uniref:response regulator transcription factor n=1 Tax=unclassified Corynebacterium TaxID=2624378 RepID=UPI002A91BA37|nr:response regulator transcription factor [Corynebacterium sp.]MDY5785395.1 response regulator transcription factor [Corynebacterium sp.]